MNNTPLITVIIIFLNERKFIKDAIESVLAQTYANWELFLVDDGSMDGSTEIALQYAAQIPEKVSYFDHPGHQNRGMSASRNLGINSARGEFIAFLDSDDLWLPYKLEHQVALMEAHPEAALLYGRSRIWYSWAGNSECLPHDSMTNPGVQLNTLVKPPTLIRLFLQNEDIVPCPSTVLVRREIIETIGGFEEEFRNLYEDMVVYAKIFLEMPVFVAGDCWVWYRQHPDNSSATAIRTGQWHPINPNPARRAFLNWLADYLSSNEIKDVEIWNILHKQLWVYHHPNLYRLLRVGKNTAEQLRKLFRLTLRQILPLPVRRWLWAQWQK